LVDKNKVVALGKKNKGSQMGTRHKTELYLLKKPAVREVGREVETSRNGRRVKITEGRKREVNMKKKKVSSGDTCCPLSRELRVVKRGK
jgi:hypothetical protein